MRVLFVNNHCLSDPTAGVTQSFRTILRWWKEAGHDVTAVTTATFESPVPWSIDEHLAPFQPSPSEVGCRSYFLDGVPVHLFATIEEQFAWQEGWLIALQPAVIVVQGSHPLLRKWLTAARQRGITTVMTVRSYRYYNPEFYTHVDHVFTCSQFLADHYALKIGRKFDVLAPPIDWSTAKVPDGQWDPKYVTFIQPRKHKGWNAVQRLAQMLVERRPDIPKIRVIASGYGIGDPIIPGPLGLERWVDFVPPTPTPIGWAAYTKLLLVPSVWEEPWGRVAAEAMINGIPSIVSERGALPDVVGSAGDIESLPEWLLPASGRLPTEDEMTDWYRKICAYWDDQDFYARRSAECAQYGADHFSEAVSRQRYLEYLEQLR